jgi:glycosyltransferase involved in cell wall biosynthesis
MVMRAVTSALRQSHPVHEVIVVDDASTDGTAALFEGTLDQRIRYVRLPENRGGAVARNIGIDLATGDWIAFLDSDDEWLPEKLEQQLCAARGRTGDLLLCCNARLVRGSVHRPYNRSAPEPDQPISEYFLCSGSSFVTSSLVVSARAARTVRYDESLRRHQDWDFTLRLLDRGMPYIYVDNELVVYHDHEAARVSKNPDVTPTLHWFAVSKQLTSKARQHLYFSQYFLADLQAQPLRAISTSIKLLIDNPIAVAGLVRKMPRFLGFRLKARMKQ